MTTAAKYLISLLILVFCAQLVQQNTFRTSEKEGVEKTAENTSEESEKEQEPSLPQFFTHHIKASSATRLFWKSFAPQTMCATENRNQPGGEATSTLRHLSFLCVFRL